MAKIPERKDESSKPHDEYVEVMGHYWGACC